jgi:hypothetical protein
MTNLQEARIALAAANGAIPPSYELEDLANDRYTEGALQFLIHDLEYAIIELTHAISLLKQNKTQNITLSD